MITLSTRIAPKMHSTDIDCSLLWFLVVLCSVSVRGAITYPDSEIECPDLSSPRVKADLYFSSHLVPFGVAHRAHLTVPEAWVYLAPSDIPGAGLGVFASTFIPAHTWLGEYDGVIVTYEEAHDKTTDYSYMWTLLKEGDIMFFVDGIDETTSNWLRYVNCPNHHSMVNVKESFCYGKVYYRTSRDLSPGTELLIYYGDEYAQMLNITDYY